MNNHPDNTRWKPGARQPRSTPGFTLVELLVVVAILAVLISLLVPIVSEARRRASETACMANVRTLTQTALHYSLDNDDWLPNWGSTAPGDNKAGSTQIRPYFIHSAWREYFEESYGLTRDFFYSPSNKRWNADEFWNIGVVGYFYFGNRVGLNNYVSSRYGSVAFARKTMDDPHFKELVADLNRQWPGTSFVTPNDSIRWGANHQYSVDGVPKGTHLGYLDGHVEFRPWEEMEHRFDYTGVRYFW